MSHSVEPIEGTDITVDRLTVSEPSITPAGSFESIPDKQPAKKRNLLDRISDLLKSDPSKLKLDAEQGADDADYQKRKADRQQKQAQIESEAIAKARESSPQWKSEQKRQEAVYKAQTREARRLAVLIEIADEKIRREVPDQRLVEWCRSQLQRSHLMGALFSKPEK